MESAPGPNVELEKELTCSICTEVLYQPLTLLDCLHTFCGSCLQDWFTWQRTAAETAPDPPPAGSQIYTCPSCRAAVRDTRHNATVATLLDMFLVANPAKTKSDQEKDEMRQKYVPGDNVIPVYEGPNKSPEDTRADEMERRLIEQARELSLRDAGVGSPSSLRPSRNAAEQASSRDRRNRVDRESSRDSRYRDVRDRGRRDDERRLRAGSNNSTLQPDDERRRRHRSESQQRSRDSSRTRRRHIEHQASIRSLISNSDVQPRDMEQEIEDFARQIQEEGLLDGLDLDNLDLTENDELSRKITEAYRRRQRERSRQETTRRSNASAASHRPDSAQATSSRPSMPTSDSGRQGSGQRSSSAGGRPSASVTHLEDRSRPPVTSTHLEVRTDPERRRRRRNSSGSRSNTDPARPRTSESRPAARSQTDLSNPRSQSTEPIGPSPFRRPSLADSRSTSMPTSNSNGQSTPTDNNTSNGGLSFSARAANTQNQTTASPTELPPDAMGLNTSTRPARSNQRPPSIVSPQNPLPSLGLLTSPTHSGASSHKRSRSQYYQEPSINCSKCGRQHIEYELHYNCAQCANGHWDLCLDCYRAGKGCQNWYGFGYTAFQRWEKAQAARGPGVPPLEPPHMLTSNRYAPPKHAPGGAEGRRTLTTEDPERRLESGMFCARCQAWANECFWRCSTCNEGDWGFCNTCVNQGFGCTHSLLPLTYVPPSASAAHTPERTPSPSSSMNSHHHDSPPRSPALRPRSATLLTGPNAGGVGNFRPLSFNTTCDVCREAIPPTRARNHCYECRSNVVPEEATQPGDYDVCVECYVGLERDGLISPENGERGWRRCPAQGHRMTLLGFEERSDGRRRVVLRDLVGGRDLDVVAMGGAGAGAGATAKGDVGGLEKWRWREAETDDVSGPTIWRERLVTKNVAATTTTTPPGSLRTGVGTAEQAIAGTDSDDNALGSFPPEGGAGQRGVAMWSRYPPAEADDELLFPRGAEIAEIGDVNGDWLVGAYMGKVGLWPAKYVRILGS